MGKCLFCKSSESTETYYPKISFNNKKFEYRQCCDCKLVYIDPILNADDLEKLYSIDYHDEFYFRGEHEYGKQLELLKKYRPSGSLLDYGCGDGSFLRFFRDKGYELFGAEYNPALVNKLKAIHSDIEFITIDSLLGGDEKFDIIHFGDVLEHLLNPSEIVSDLKKHLKPGGVLFIEGPIEHNFHLAYPTRAGYFTVRKWIQPQRRVPMRPFHVLFANRKNQLSFFERLHYKTIHYSVFEWAWPYPDSWKNATSLKLKLEWAIGKISVAGSHIVKGWGNRFYYIGTPE
jgi:2-polyprenyl-3-methyl-5-hydroxy-6-metoxy-1,4-benzoquinol methylase